MYLKRYHDITSSASGGWRILKLLELNRLPASQRYQRHDHRWKRYEKPLPGHRVQIDVKVIAPIGAVAGRRTTYYQFTAIDDRTRLRVLLADASLSKVHLARRYVLPNFARWTVLGSKAG
jgi:hypothetical protein